MNATSRDVLEVLVEGGPADPAGLAATLKVTEKDLKVPLRVLTDNQMVLAEQAAGENVRYTVTSVGQKAFAASIRKTTRYS